MGQLTLYAVRHAESEANATIRDYIARGEVLPGSTWGPPLTAKGEAQAAEVGEWFATEYQWSIPQQRYVSYYTRALQTAAAIWPESTWRRDSRLAEQQRGIWHTMHRDTIAEKLPQELDRLQRDGWYHYRPIGGESVPDVELRIYSFVDNILRKNRLPTVVAVTHGHWIGILKAMCDGRCDPQANMATSVDRSALPKNGEVTRFLIDAEFGLERATYQSVFVPETV